MTKTTETKQIEMADQPLKGKENQRSKPLWQKINEWRKTLFTPKSDSTIKPNQNIRSKETNNQKIENRKAIAITALAILGIGTSATVFQIYNSAENQNQRLATEIIQQSFGVNGTTGLSQKIEAGNIGQFQQSEIKNKVASSFKTNLDERLKIQIPLTAPQIKEIIPEVLNEALSMEANIQGIDLELQNKKQIKLLVESKSTTEAAEHWRDRLNNKKNESAQKFVDAKSILAKKLTQIKNEYSGFKSIGFSSVSPQLLSKLAFDRVNGLNTDLHLANNTIHIGPNPFQRLNTAESKEFYKVAGRGEIDKSFNLVINNEVFYVEGSVVNPTPSKTFTIKGNKFIVPTVIPTIPTKSKLKNI